MNEKPVKKGVIGYEQIVAARVYGSWRFYDKKFKKKYSHLSKKQLDKLLFT